jgi:type IV secretory pathway ATPase VirB11/archaellum biosynthesis ATPase
MCQQWTLQAVGGRRGRAELGAKDVLDDVLQQRKDVWVLGEVCKYSLGGRLRLVGPR